MKTLAFFFALMVPALGRLDETIDQCRARYGPETEKTKSSEISKTFEKGGFSITITFSYGIAKSMLVLRSRDSNGERGEELSEAEIKALLDANKGHSSWKKDDRFWNTDDGNRMAMSDGASLFMSDKVKVPPPPAEVGKQVENLKGF